MSACSGASGSPVGGGMRSMTASSSSGTPSPVLALMRRMSSAGDAEHPLDLRGVPVGLGRRQVDLVEGGHDLEVVLEGQVAVGQRLGLDALGGVDEQDHALAGGQRPRHLVAEVDVAGGVDEVEHVVAVVQADGLELDRDAPLALEVHRVEVLGPHVAGVDGAASARACGRRASTCRGRCGRSTRSCGCGRGRSWSLPTILAVAAAAWPTSLDRLSVVRRPEDRSWPTSRARSSATARTRSGTSATRRCAPS